MESQQQRRRKQEKPRHLNNQDGDELGEAQPPPELSEDRTPDLSSSKEDNFLCKSCHARMPTRSELDIHLSSCHQHQNIAPQVSWEEFQSQNRPPVINLMKKKFSFVQSNSCSDNSKSEDDQCRDEIDATPLTRSPRNCETIEKEASDAKKMRMSEQDDESDDDHLTPPRNVLFKNPSMNLHQLNMLLLQLQQHQIILWQVLDAIRKKVIEDKMPANSEVFSDLTSLFLRHQKEIAHISASYQLAVGFLGRGDLVKPQDSQYLHYQNLYNSLRFKQNAQADEIRNGTQNAEKVEINQTQRSVEVPSPHVFQQDKADDDDEDDDDEEDTVEGEDSLKCSVCGDSFTSKDNLKIHIQQHLEQNLNKIHAEVQPSKSMIDEEMEENQDSIRGDHPLEEEQHEMKNKFSDSNAFSERLSGVRYICPDGSKDCQFQETCQTFSQTSSSEQMSVTSRRELSYDGISNGSSFKGKDFKSPLVALSSMSSALNFTKTPMSLIFPGEGSNSSQAYQSFRYNTPTSLMKSAILAPNGHDDPLEQYMEIQVTENSKMEELIKEGESKVSDPNECAICHRVLSCRSALQMHYRTHTGERPYKCKLCSRTFTTKGNLKTHMSVHRGKPLQRQLHKCPICSREFSNPLVLQQHFRSHTSDPQKAFSSIFPGMIPGMFMPPINPFFSYPINPNPYFNPLFSSQFAAKNLSNISKVFQEQRTSPKKLVETLINKLPTNSGIHEIQMVKESSEVDRKQERRVQDSNNGMEASKPGNGKFEDISDKSSGESDIEADDRKEQNNTFQNEEARKSSYNSAIKLEENHVSSEPNHPYMSPLVALADRVNALNHHYVHPEGQRLQREGNLQMDAPRNIPEDFNKSLSLRTPTSLNTPNSSFLSSPLFIKAAESKSGLNETHPNATIGGKASAACPICGKMFSCKSAVDIHMRSHTKERPFRCEYCDRAFTTKGNLKQHVGTNHHVIARVSEQTNQQTGVKTANWMSDSSSSKSASPFNSSGVIASTNMTASPKIKQELSGGDNQNEPKPKEQGNPSQEPVKQNPNGARYFCTICEKPFSSTSALQIHSRTHTGDRPFVCPTCNKAFTTKGNLKVHMGTHAWNKVPSRRGRRMSVEPLGPQFNAALGKDQIMNPSIMASFHQKLNCADRFPYSFMGLPTPSMFQSKLPEHHLQQAFHGKLPLMASLQGQSLCYPSYPGNYDIVKSPTAKSILPHEVTVKTEKMDNETELDLSIKKPSPLSHQHQANL